MEGQPAEAGWLHPSWDVNTWQFKILIFEITTGGEKDPDRVGFYVCLHARERELRSCCRQAANLTLMAAAPRQPAIAATTPAAHELKRFGFPWRVPPGDGFVPPLCPPQQAGLSGKREQPE